MTNETTVIRFLQAIALALAALVVGLALFWHPEPPAPAIPSAKAPAGGDFTLTGADGPVRLADFRGKAVLIYFGYTFCPDVCPTALTAIAEGLRRLPSEQIGQVAVLFVSVDPERDTPGHLKEYGAFFHPAIIGMTGKPEIIADIARRYGVFYARQEAVSAGGSYVVDHTSDTFLVAPDGTLRGKLPHGTPPETLVDAIGKLLQSSSNP